MHREVAKIDRAGKVLELGPDTLTHLRFEDLERTTQYDVVEPFRKLYEDSPEKDRVSTFYDDISEIPLISTYDRIISIDVLTSVTDLPLLVACSGQLIHDRAVTQHTFGSDPSFLY